LKTLWKKWRYLVLYAVKNSYNPLGQFRRNTINTIYVFLISLIKTLMGKFKRYTSSCVHIISLKNFSWETTWKLIKRKECNVMHLNGIIYRGSPIEHCKSLSLFIVMPLTHLSNIAKGNDFVNKYAWLSQYVICKKLISPLSQSWCP
jgi:hypothetical protein